MVLLFLFVLPTFLKNLKYVFQLSPFALGALVSATLVIIFSMPLNISNLNSQYLSFKDLSFSNILAVASMNGFAFICHPSISPIIKQNKDQTTNTKAVYIGYSITAAMYLLVGILGSMAIYGKNSDNKPFVMDYFQGKFQAPTIGLLNFVYLALIVPIFPFVAKSQLIQICPQNVKKNSRIWLYASIIYAILWTGINIFFIFADTSPNIVISFLGAVMCYFITYFLPIWMTIKAGEAVYHKLGSQISPKDSLESQQRKQVIIPQKWSVQSTDLIDSLISTDEQNFIRKMIPVSMVKKVIYFVILAYGLGLMCGQLVSIISGFV